MANTADPVGALIDEVAEIILEHRPGQRRRLTSSEFVARELAEEIVDFVWGWQPPPSEDGAQAA